MMLMTKMSVRSLMVIMAMMAMLMLMRIMLTTMLLVRAGSVLLWKNGMKIKQEGWI